MLGVYYVYNGQLQEAEDTMQEVLAFGREFSGEFMEDIAQGVLSLVSFLKGDLQSLATAEDVARKILADGGKFICVQFYNAIGMSFSLLIGSIPDAVQKAKDYRNKAIELAREIGAKGELGIAYLGLSQLHSAEGDKDKARHCISEALSLFEQCELENYLSQAKQALESLK
jgi:tetratricopeptide (TPR) repeat protein